MCTTTPKGAPAPPSPAKARHSTPAEQHLHPLRCRAQFFRVPRTLATNSVGRAEPQRIAAERPLPAARCPCVISAPLPHLRTALVTTGCRPFTPESHAQCRGSAHCEAPTAHSRLHSAPPTPASAPVHRHPLPDRAISSHADTLPHAARPLSLPALCGPLCAARCLLVPLCVRIVRGLCGPCGPAACVFVYASVLCGFVCAPTAPLGS